MSKLVRSTIATLALGLALSVSAAESADNDIKAALADISRYEQQFGGATEARASNVNRTRKLLGLVRQRLDRSANKSHESWVEADQRFNALMTHLDSLLAPAPSQPQPATASATAQPASSADPAPAKQMISQQRAWIAKLNRDIASATKTLDQNGPKPFQDAEYVAERQRVLDNLRQSLTRFEDFPDDPEVVTATQALAGYEQMMGLGREHAAAELAVLGDVQARLREMHERRKSTRIPAAPTEPYRDGAIDAWLQQIATLRQSMAADHAALAPIQARAHLPLARGTPEQGARYDFQDVERMQAGLVGDVRSIDESLARFTADLDLQVAQVDGVLAYFESLDPHDASARSNGYLGEGQAEEARARLAGVQGLVRNAMTFDQRLGRTPPSDREALLRRVGQVAADYETRRETALAVVRMPAAASSDDDLLAIARQTLARPEYGVGDVLRLVVNADKTHHEKETSEIEIDKLDVSLTGNVTASGTQTTWRYAWDQFQVATAEPVGDKHYVFYNTLKYFTSGASTTPLNRWLLSGRLQSVQIPEANIPLD